MLSDDTADVERCVRDWGSGVRRLPRRHYSHKYELRHWLYQVTCSIGGSILRPVLSFRGGLAEGFEALGTMVQSEMAAEDAACTFEEGHEYERAVHYLN